ncbi:MAG: YgiT-type zinc finger domain-containing protein [Anaerolineaceae bacterium 4572_5.1]|nr:MAG: YgiT-type zinc finger domain-containing protein [Anaerolineaceae bacterium 4572_5.1]
MKYVKKCPRCNGTVVEKEVTEVLYGGVNTAILSVKTGVCLLCGERLYTPELVRQFETIETKLEHQETTEFHPVGQSLAA